MKVSDWRDTRALYYAVPAILILLARWALPALICDDAYVSLRVAENTASGSSMVFNLGENTYVSTSPLWVLLLASSRILFGDVVVSAKVLGTCFEVLLVLSTVHLAERTRLGLKAGLFAALLLVTNPVFLLTSFSGMELPLYLLVIILTALFLSLRRYGLALALGALAVWVRFDGVLVLGVAVAWSLWFQRKQMRSRPMRVLMNASPAAVIALAYVFFGISFFETWVPMSVYRKALTSASFLSPEWFQACWIVLKEFGNAAVGKSGYWYTHGTMLPFMGLPLIIGGVLPAVRKGTTLAPLLVITAVYVGAFSFSGSDYAEYFPWYFAPILPALYLVCGAGLVWILSAISHRVRVFPESKRTGVLAGLTVLGWLAASVVPVRDDAVKLAGKYEVREHAYATASVWIGTYLGGNALVAANEIGTIGFFLPSEARVLDMFGLLSRKNELEVSYKDKIRKQRPHCILTRYGFSYREGIEAEMPNAYRWIRYRSLDIGVRSDLMKYLQPHIRDIEPIYQSLDMDHEYDWSGPRLGEWRAFPSGVPR